MLLFDCELHEAHFCNLLGQSNVYGLSNVVLPDGTTKVLVSPLKEKILCVEYLREKGNLKPISRELQFAYIPDDAEIVSTDAFSKQGETGGFIVGITVAKDSGTSKPSHYFNVYCPWEKDAVYNLESIAHGWSTMELDFIPYYLTHTESTYDNENETVFLLCGSDHKVHLYKEEKEIAIIRFMENPAEKEFPEFNDLPSVPLWIDIKYNDKNERIAAVGCQNGFLRISVVSLKSHEVVKKWELHHDGPITCVKLFQSETTPAVPPFPKLQEFCSDKNSQEKAETKNGYHLLVTGALEIAVVYRNASKDGFTNQDVLPDSDMYDCTLCAVIGDVDWDGHNEILLGTYGQEILAYKYHATSTKQNVSTPDSNTIEKLSIDTDSSTNDNPVSQPAGEYRLHWKRSFSQPVTAMQYVDITGDGLSELVVVTVRGIHILQHCLTEATKRCMECLIAITKPKEEDNNQESQYLPTEPDGTLPETKGTEDNKTETDVEQTGQRTMTASPVGEGGATASGQKRVATLKEIAEAAKSKVSAESVKKAEEGATTQLDRPTDEDSGR